MTPEQRQRIIAFNIRRKIEGELASKMLEVKTALEKLSPIPTFAQLKDLLEVLRKIIESLPEIGRQEMKDEDDEKTLSGLISED